MFGWESELLEQKQVYKLSFILLRGKELLRVFPEILGTEPPREEWPGPF